MLPTGTMFNVVVVFSETFDPPSDLTDGLLKSLQPLKCAVVSTHFKLSSKNVATEMTQRIDERQHLLAGNCVFAFWLRQRAAEIRNGLLNSGPYALRKHAANAEVARVAIDDERFCKVWIRESDCVCNRYLNCGDRELSHSFVNWNWRSLINNLLSGSTIRAKFLINFPESRISQKAAGFIWVVWTRPLFDATKFFLVGADSFITDDIAQKVY